MLAPQKGSHRLMNFPSLGPHCYTYERLVRSSLKYPRSKDGEHCSKGWVLTLLAWFQLEQ